MASFRPISIALADTILARHPDPDTIPFKKWCYVQGYILCGFEKLYDITGDSRYLDYLRRFVDQHVQPDGSILDFNGDSLDDIMAGTVIVALYARTHEKKYHLAADRIRAAFTDYPRNADGGFWHARNLPGQMWIDGVFMGMMFLSRYAAVMGNCPNCWDEVARQIQTFASHCRKGETGLFLHAYDESRQASWADPETGLSPEVWSEGLGWYALVLVETLALMPLEHPERERIMAIFLELAQGLLKAQDARSGLWFQVVDKGDRADNWQDTSGSAMFIYALQRGVDLGYLDSQTYAPSAQRGYAGLRNKTQVNNEGLVDVLDACDGVCVQDSYAVYINYPRSVNAKEAVGGCLWATTIMEKP